MLRGGMDVAAIREAVSAIWRVRADRYSEEREEGTTRHKVEMSYLGG
jgi:hypothetical protein